MTPRELAAYGWIGRWSPGIGDPTPIGWITVILYALCAWQCYRLATRHGGLVGKSESTLWWILALALVALGINKQLDLQTALTEFGRIVAHQDGWYERRRAVQVVFIYGVAALAGCAALAMAYLAREAPLATMAAIAGSVCLLAFIAIRAASFHHFDQFFGSEYFGLRTNWILEIGGICIILFSARRRWRSICKRSTAT